MLGSGVRTPITVVAPTIVVTTIPGITSEVEQLTTAVFGFSIHEHSPSPSPIKTSRGDSPSTPVEEDSFKQTRLSEGAESEALAYFFRLHDILPSRVPSTPEEFTAVVANENLTFVQSLFVTDGQGFLSHVSRTLFRVGSLVSMVVAS